MNNCPPGQTATELGCISQDPVKFSGEIYGIGLGIIGGIALIAIMYGGYLIITSKGNPSLLNTGKSYILYAILGIILAFAGFALYRIAAVDILKIPGFGNSQ